MVTINASLEQEYTNFAEQLLVEFCEKSEREVALDVKGFWKRWVSLHTRLFHLLSENKVSSTEIDFHLMVPKTRLRLMSALVQGLNVRNASGPERSHIQSLIAHHDKFFESLLKKAIGDLEIVLSKAFFAKKALGAYAQVTQFRGNE